MQLKHIEHPEDTILTGDLSAINWFTLQGKVSLKIDGCPAIVWGTNPENEKFFVGTKSVFNKVKKMICHSHEEIDILYACLLYTSPSPRDATLSRMPSSA